MNITFFIPNLQIGGAERTVVRLSNKLTELDHNVEVVVTTDQGELKSEFNREVDIINLGVKTIPNIGVLSSVPHLIKFFKNSSPDIFVSFMKHSNIAALIAHQFVPGAGPIIISERNPPSQTLNNNHKLRKVTILSLMKICYPHADAITSLSNGVAKDLAACIDIDSRNIQTIYNPVYNSKLVGMMNEEVHHRWFENNDLKTVIGVGTLKPQNDFSTLISAFSMVIKRRDARLIIVGEGEQRNELETLVQRLGLEQVVELPGQINNPFPYMKEASLFVSSSAWEGFGNVIVEAMACGCPVVATDCLSGPREILQDGEYGPLVPVGQPDKMADAIITTLDNPPSSKKLVERAQTFSADRITKEYISLFNDITRS